MARLPDKYQRMVRMAIQGLSHEEIARRLNYSKGNSICNALKRPAVAEAHLAMQLEINERAILDQAQPPEDQIQVLVPPAIQALSDAVHDKEAPARRISAAEKILKMAGYGGTQKHEITGEFKTINVEIVAQLGAVLKEMALFDSTVNVPTPA